MNCIDCGAEFERKKYDTKSIRCRSCQKIASYARIEIKRKLLMATGQKTYQQRYKERHGITRIKSDVPVPWGYFYRKGVRKYQRCIFKGKLTTMHRAIWEMANGPIPEGCEIHHKDHNGLNNDINNLQMLTRKEHFDLHANFGYKGYVPHNKGKKFDTTNAVIVRNNNHRLVCFHTRKLFVAMGASKAAKFLGINTCSIYNRVDRAKELIGCLPILINCSAESPQEPA